MKWIFLLILFMSCKQKPEDLLLEFLKNHYTGKEQLNYNLIAQEDHHLYGDKILNDAEEFFLRDFFAKTKYQVLDVIEKEDYSIVFIESYYLDLNLFILEIMTDRSLSYKKYMRDFNQYRTQKEFYILQKIDGNWKIRLSFDFFDKFAYNIKLFKIMNLLEANHYGYKRYLHLKSTELDQYFLQKLGFLPSDLDYEFMDSVIGRNFLYQKYKLMSFLDFLEYKGYVRIRSELVLDEDYFFDKFINTLIKVQDPNSGYIQKKDISFFMSNLSKEFFDLGIDFSFEGNLPKVVKVKENSLNQELKKDDFVLELNKVGNLDKNEFWRIVQEYEELDALILRDKEKFNFKFKKIKDRSSLLEFKKIGNFKYIKIPSLYHSKDKSAVEDLAEIIFNTSESKLILDLRDNPGGLLMDAIQILEFFIEGDLLELKSKDHKFKKFSSNKKKIYQGEIFIIINEKTASSAEIIAGVLQESVKAKVFGARSFGKGTTQILLDLKNDYFYGDLNNEIDFGLLKVTNSLFLTPLGYSIQQNGVIPDFEIISHSLREKDLSFSIKSESYPKKSKIINYNENQILDYILNNY